jgi:hypothetical protein
MNPQHDGVTVIVQLLMLTDKVIGIPIDLHGGSDRHDCSQLGRDVWSRQQ